MKTAHLTLHLCVCAEVKGGGCNGTKRELKGVFPAPSREEHEAATNKVKAHLKSSIKKAGSCRGQQM